MPFVASTLQIGGYHSYQNRKLQAARVTFILFQESLVKLQKQNQRCPALFDLIKKL